MRVVMGGVASRHDLPLDKLDDLQLAVETIVTEEPSEGEELLLELAAGSAGFRVRLSGLLNQSVRAALIAVDPFRPCEGCLLDVRFLLDSLVDTLEVEETGGDSYGVSMEKRAT